MILTEYDEEQHLKNVAEYYYEEGYKQGFQKGYKLGFQKGLEEARQEGARLERNGILKKLIKGGITAKEIAELLAAEEANIEGLD